MGSSSAIFNGNSRYASDFQSVIDRTVAIASLPISQLNNEKDKLTNQSTALSAIDDKFTSLENAVAAIQNSLGRSSFEVTVTDDSVASATVGDGAMEGTYSIEVTDLGAYTTTLTADSGPLKVTDPSKQNISAQTSFTLTVGTTKYDITPQQNTLNSLAGAINATAGADVRATIVNVGPASAPDYRLSLQSTKLGDLGIQLSDGTDLQTEQVRGSTARYKVNGASNEAESGSRTVTIAPGLTVSLLAKSPAGAATSITLIRKSSAASDALASFVTAYNAAVDEVDKHRGQGAGALNGTPIVNDLSRTLGEMTDYVASGDRISSLASLGIEFDRTGKLSFNALTFMAADLDDSAGVLNFLGSSTSNGFLNTATNALKALRDPVDGTIPTTLTSIQNQISTEDRLISDNQDRVDQLKQQLQEQMAASDALIAGLEQQYTYLNGMFQTMLANASQYQ